MVKIGLAASVMGLGAWWFDRFAQDCHILIHSGGAMVLGGVLYLAMSLLLRSEEMNTLRGILLLGRSG